MSHEALMYAAQVLRKPYLENHHGGKDASLKLCEEDMENIKTHRLNHKMMPKITREEIIVRSNEYFG